jgi:hypothetical protein
MDMGIGMGMGGIKEEGRRSGEARKEIISIPLK